MRIKSLVALLTAATIGTYGCRTDGTEDSGVSDTGVSAEDQFIEPPYKTDECTTDSPELDAEALDTCTDSMVEAASYLAHTIREGAESAILAPSGAVFGSDGTYTATLDFEAEAGDANLTDILLYALPNGDYVGTQAYFSADRVEVHQATLLLEEEGQYGVDELVTTLKSYSGSEDGKKFGYVVFKTDVVGYMVEDRTELDAIELAMPELVWFDDAQGCFVEDEGVCYQVSEPDGIIDKMYDVHELLSLDNVLEVAFDQSTTE
jgi:hypothetical protein